MRGSLAKALMVIGLGGLLAVGLAVSALASSHGSASSAATTSESTTEHSTSTTEQPMAMPNLYIAAIDARAEVPAPKGTSSKAGGAFALWLTHTGTKYTASWKLIFGKLTGKAVAAHIHKGKPGTAGPVLVPLCGPCKSGQTGTASISAATLASIRTGAAYVNVHTAKNPGGEVRGQIK
jgi:CHRD domain